MINHMHPYICTMVLNMSYKEITYKNALKVIDKIYNESKYNEDVDLFRITDIINSVNDNQFASKEWLVDSLMPWMKRYDEKIHNICILGAWSGLTSFLIQEKWRKKRCMDYIDIWNIDVDPMCKVIGQQIFGEHKHIHFITDDAVNLFIEKTKKHEVVINTSCEHIELEDLQLMTNLKRKNALGCYQSNNYHSVTSHINTCSSLQEFAESLKLSKIVHTDELIRDNYTRYMVIGY